jgi:hypothetical protein
MVCVIIFNGNILLGHVSIAERTSNSNSLFHFWITAITILLITPTAAHAVVVFYAVMAAVSGVYMGDDETLEG